MAKTAGDTIINVVLELGDENALIVFEDAKLDGAVRDASKVPSSRKAKGPQQLLVSLYGEASMTESSSG